MQTPGEPHGLCHRTLVLCRLFWVLLVLGPSIGSASARAGPLLQGGLSSGDSSQRRTGDAAGWLSQDSPSRGAGGSAPAPHVPWCRRPEPASGHTSSIGQPARQAVAGPPGHWMSPQLSLQFRGRHALPICCLSVSRAAGHKAAGKRRT